MLTYHIRKRVFKLDEDVEIDFPVDAEIVLTLAPDQPFGMSASGGRTVRYGVAALMHYNANNGRVTIESQEPLEPLEVRIQDGPDRLVVLEGNRLVVQQPFESFRDLDSLIESLCLGLPLFLNLEFADPPFIGSVTGSLGGTGFQWILEGLEIPFQPITQEIQEQRFADAWQRLPLLSDEEGGRRVLAALHYFHVACRLERSGSTAGEFVSEALLNLAKVIEVLFPGKTGEETIDAARSGLAELGYPSPQIEARFVPALALRNQIDVAHVHLAIFKSSDLAVLHRYVLDAEKYFKELLRRVIKALEAGDWDVAGPDDLSPRPGALTVIERLRQAQVAADEAEEKGQ